MTPVTQGRQGLSAQEDTAWRSWYFKLCTPLFDSSFFRTGLPEDTTLIAVSVYEFMTYWLRPGEDN